MAATIDWTQTRTNTVTGFEVANVVNTATDIPKELFVYRQNDDGFSHVATLTDLAYPTVNTVGTDYYRQDNALREYEDVVTALEFANHVKFRIESLLTYYNAGDLATFPGTDNITTPTP